MATFLTSNEANFTESLMEKCGNSKKFLLSRIEYEKIIQELKEASSTTTKKTRRQYFLMEKYEILECGGEEKLIRKRVSKESDPVYFVAIEDTYQVLNRAHLATGHGGRDRMHKYLSGKYANVTLKSIELFKSFCLPCQEKKNKNWSEVGLSDEVAQDSLPSLEIGESTRDEGEQFSRVSCENETVLENYWGTELYSTIG